MMKQWIREIVVSTDHADNGACSSSFTSRSNEKPPPAPNMPLGNLFFSFPPSPNETIITQQQPLTSDDPTAAAAPAADFASELLIEVLNEVAARNRAINCRQEAPNHLILRAL